MAGTVLLQGSAPPPSVGKLELLGTAGAWPTVCCVVHGSPLWLMTLPFRCQGVLGLLSPWFGKCTVFPGIFLEPVSPVIAVVEPRRGGVWSVFGLCP